MQRVDLIKLLGDDAESFESLIDTSNIDRMALLDRVSDKINRVIRVSDFSIGVVTKGEDLYATYKFRDKGSLCKAAFKIVAGESNLDKLVSTILDISDGTDALDILNKAISQNNNTTELKLRWGKSIKPKVVHWEYKSLEIAISSESLDIILNKYRSGTDKYMTWVNEICSKPIEENIFGLLTNSHNIKIYSDLGIKLSITNDNIEETLVNCMLSRPDAIKLMSNSKNSLAKQTIMSLEIIEELGKFAAIVLWKADYNTKSITNYLLDGTVADIEKQEIITNNAICSRIESKIAITSAEIDKIFKD